MIANALGLYFHEAHKYSKYRVAKVEYKRSQKSPDETAGFIEFDDN